MYSGIHIEPDANLPFNTAFIKFCTELLYSIFGLVNKYCKPAKLTIFDGLLKRQHCVKCTESTRGHMHHIVSMILYLCMYSDGQILQVSLWKTCV